MSKLQKRGFFMLLISFLLMIGIARAQDTAAPVVLVIDDNIWTWTESTGKLEQITTRGDIHNLAISPDGKYVAYRAFADIAQDMLANEGGTADWFFPEDIFILELATGIETQLAEQWAGAGYAGTSLESGDLRSAPVWSPDGKRLAWVNVDFPHQRDKYPELFAYDVELKQDIAPIALIWDAVPDLPEPPQIIWSKGGIILQSAITDSEDPGLLDWAFLVVDVEKHASSEFVIDNTLHKVLIDTLPIDYNGKPYLGVRYNTHEWELIDLTNGEAQPVPGLLEIFNPSLPDKAYSMTVDLTPSLSNWGQIFPPHEVEPVATVDLALQPLGAIQPSPDGKAFAFLEGLSDGGVTYITIWRDGERQFIVIPEEKRLTEFVWGSAVWRVHLGV